MKRNNRLEAILITIVALLMGFAVSSIRNMNISFWLFCLIPVICFIVHFLFIYFANKDNNWNKRDKLFFAVLLLVFLTFIYIVYSKNGIADIYGKVTVCLSIYTAYGLCIFSYGAFVKKWEVEKLFLILGVSVGMFMMVNLPLRVAPDETTHMLTAYKISDVILGKSDRNTYKTMIRQTDEDMFYENIEFACDRNMMNRYYRHALDVPNLTEIETEKISLNGSDIAYILPGIMISLCRILHFNGFWTLLSGRMINLIFYLFLIYSGIKIMPFGKEIAFTIALLPMSMQQGMSYSYDSILIGTSIYTVCATMNWYYSYENRNKFYYIGMVISSLILILIKSHAYFMVGLFPVYMFCQKKYKLDKFWKIIKYLILMLITLFLVYTLLDLAGVTPDLFDEPANLIAWDDYKPGYTFAYLINNPGRLLFVYINTIKVSGVNYILTMIGMHLGWLNIRLSKITIIIYILSLFLAFTKKEKNQNIINLEIKTKKYMIVAILVTVAGIFCGLLISWTPLEYKIIQGLQGRYFLEILPFLGLLVYGSRLKWNIKVGYIYLFELIGIITMIIQLGIRF